MKVLIVGSGARENALCWRLSQSPEVVKIWCAPGNPGTADCATNVDIPAHDIRALADFAQAFGVDLTVVGPEEPLGNGIVDVFRERGLRIFGPSAAAARLETSKSFAKEVMAAAGIPTAASWTFDKRSEATQFCRSKKAPLVLKADGLAAGKGVAVCLTEGEVEEGLAYIFEVLKSSRIVVEEMLIGPEASFFVVTDGEQVLPLGAAHDYKRLRDGNVGPNTGGMGSVSPTPYLSAEQEQLVMSSVVYPLLQEMKARGTPYTGFLYVGLMIGDDSVPKVIEFNVRLGDPECQALMRRVEGDLFPVLFDLAEGAPLSSKISLSSKTAVVVVQASHGYPSGKRLGDKISGVAKAERLRDVVVFHAGTAINHVGELVTQGGRVLTISALGATLEAACARVYEAANQISFEGQVMRRDIGQSNSAAGSAS